MNVVNNFSKNYQKINITVIYISILILVTYSTAILLHHFILSSKTDNIIRLLTSPFNSYFEGHYYDNIVFVAIILLITEVYLKFRNQKKLVSVVFISTLLATYTVSLGQAFGGLSPGAGSSIVAFSIFVFIVIFFILDMILFTFNVYKHRDKFEGIVKIIVLSLSVFIDIMMFLILYEALKIYYTSYLSEIGIRLVNPHVSGLIFFFIIFFVLNFIQSYFAKNLNKHR